MSKKSNSYCPKCMYQLTEEEVALQMKSRKPYVHVGCLLSVAARWKDLGRQLLSYIEDQHNGVNCPMCGCKPGHSPECVYEEAVRAFKG